ncbi:hypothetical protein ABG067_002594 [Albugo candida]|uniref:WRKY19-like zinc finger domain-containing protein n=2 Tax=Albugo candida TaxID=65357 RepID=A0A024G058_9STRA|nr:unnamed protein product [Albugo candida]|eukprot:CCI40237.1 unnamed protein product [Albugo candida]
MDHSSEESTLLMDEGYLRFLGGSRSQEDARLEVEIRHITNGNAVEDCTLDFRSSITDNPCFEELESAELSTEDTTRRDHHSELAASAYSQSHSNRAESELATTRNACGTPEKERHVDDTDFDATNAATAAVSFAQMLLAHAEQKSRQNSKVMTRVARDLPLQDDDFIRMHFVGTSIATPIALSDRKQSSALHLMKNTGLAGADISNAHSLSSERSSTVTSHASRSDMPESRLLQTQHDSQLCTAQRNTSSHIAPNPSNRNNNPPEYESATSFANENDELDIQLHLDLSLGNSNRGEIPYDSSFCLQRETNSAPKNNVGSDSNPADISGTTTSSITPSEAILSNVFGDGERLQVSMAHVAEVKIGRHQCRYHGKKLNRCVRPSTGLDGRCAIHKSSQFCKHARCEKFNQGNGFCIRHGGGKKWHGGKPLCAVDGCGNKRMEGGYCKSHGGGRYCQFEGCKKRDIGGGFCIAHGGGKKCREKACGKVDRGGGFCKRHGGGKKCEADQCRNWAIGGGVCSDHKGPGKRCKTIGCTKHDLGGGHCIAHGGGRKCIVDGCEKIRQVNKRCRGHGGKLLCRVDGCERAAQNFKLCKTHGGGKRCLSDGCTNMQKGGGYCIRHGGGTKCKTEGCQAVDRGGGHCKAHGGGKKCGGQNCKKWVIGGGLCSDHLDIMLMHQNDEMAQFAANCSYLSSEGIVL